MTEQSSKTTPVEPPFRGRAFIFAPALLTGIFMLIIGGLLHFAYSQSREAKQKQLKESLQITISAIKQNLSGRMDFLNLLADEFSRGVLDQYTFNQQTFRLIADHPELRKIFYADRDFKFRWISPVESNKEFIGTKITLPEPLRVINKTSRTGRPCYTRPFTPPGRDRELEVYLPVFREEKFLGMFGAAYTVEGILKNLVPHSVRRSYRVSLIDPVSGPVTTQLSGFREIDPRFSLEAHLKPHFSGTIVRLDRYADDFFGWWWWTFLLLAAVPAGIVIWSTAVLRRNVNAFAVYEKTLIERQSKSKKLVAELSQSNEELEQFAYVASHDLQEPLHKIRAFSELLMKSYASDLNPTARDYLERMHGASGRLQGMIENLLALSRVTTQAEPFKKVDLNKTLDDVVSDLELMIQKLDAVIYLDSLPTIDADPAQMNQLFANLMKNALKYHRPRVKPEIKVYCESQLGEGDGFIGRERFCRIYVSDNGIGFEEEYIDRIFQPFEQLHPRSKHGGLGIGLAICRKIVRRHGGTIDAYSTPGRGSTFFIHLPYHPTGINSEEV